MEWVDSHCHLQERYLDASEGETVLEALRRAAAAGVAAVVCVGTDEATSRQALELAAASAQGSLGDDLPDVRAVIGVHPHEANEPTGWISSVVADAGQWVVGIGECGLDYHYEHAPRSEQRRSFAAQIALAHEWGSALVIHARDAWDDLFEILDAEGVPENTVLHCFTGGPVEARRCVERGLFVSFSGIITFKNAEDVRMAARDVPVDQLLVETDSPFLAPTPHRGRTNEPAYVGLVGEAVALSMGLAVEDVAQATTQSARQIFRI